MVKIILNEDIRKELWQYAYSIGVDVRVMKYDEISKKLELIFNTPPTQAQIDLMKLQVPILNKTKKFKNASNFESFMIDLTPAQAEAYIDANVTNLAEAKEFLKRLTKAVLFLYDKL